ncbi:1-(5-phosphoribosyl)-5-[(5-phosphoribosylamino)methylideneamino]imidazole-4-carboxamide isomerase [Methanothermobacter tenebrarum]|uniref:1-(5-phosphoribosyl)-5-[(5-phosphoribosylamino)methylideneamino] imidazole-4-carboxamide isomerase n=1 Tax=Methanothermobacter tenebrarum TaxID=680118 RepID=A0A328PCB0_9EURY|nr:1-(5-phosphoribosyl)-5-[(5-phosphoribosylamino)methylideneamino]imidazole-4-carboxamide isomerase [Methanothermobacter tenebrarum]NPV64904.1 1-(5-phosphoribosyl)-5-[(5-phosphoribosylamino)methylideneamino]imidazole-4-carboxamide isomerase [Methanobacteriaceae archaeon]RAO79400.1 1-(5-phosphoribosyl)-5-((5-phosphoribosylamino)methylideneamino)imidazole-4-carboxamide isomerase [Methanothermobacter tenebrarum]
MLIIPAVDIKDGKCVQLVQGMPGTEQVIIDDPIGAAMKWEEMGASTLHLIDLDGALGTGTNFHIIKEIIRSLSIPVQLGGGIRTREYAQKLLDIGVERIIIGTMAIKNPEIVQKLSREYGSDHIMVAVDSKDSKVLIKGWTKKTTMEAPSLARLFEKKGAGSILFTNVNVEGLLKGVDIKPLKDLIMAVKIPIVYSGGVTSIKDIKILKKTGVRGVVIGSALYKGKIDFKEALKYEDP